MYSIKFKRHWLTSLPLFLVSLSCSSEKGSTDTLVRLNPSEQKEIIVEEIIESVSFDDMADSVNHVVLQSIDNGTTFLGNVEKVMFFNERIYVLDTKVAKGLFCFNADGKHMFSLNQKGNGPGEFVRISDFDINENEEEIIVYDEGNGRMSLFSLNGQYLGERQRFSSMGILPDCFVQLGDKTVLYNKNNCSNSGCNSIHILGPNGELISKGLNNEHLSGFNVDFGTPIARNSDEVIFSQILNDTLYLLEAELFTQTPYIIDFGKYKMNEKEREELISNPNLIGSFILSSNKTTGLAYININEDFILSTFIINSTYATLIIERSTSKYTAFKNYEFIPEKHIPTFTVTGSYENRFIFYRNNENLVDFKKSLGSFQKHPFHDLIESIDEDTNGLITTVKFKGF